MAALTGLLGWPIASLGAHQRVMRLVSGLVGCLSIGMGLFWGYPFISRLLSN